MKEERAFVLDASVALGWAFNDESSPYADRVLDSLTESVGIVPFLWPLEVGNGLLVAERRGRLTHADTVQFLNLLMDLPIRVETQPLGLIFGEVLELARKEGLSSYDASYLETAMRQGLPLATQDSSLLDAASRSGVRIFMG